MALAHLTDEQTRTWTREQKTAGGLRTSTAATSRS
jgi:hypothetical protein